MQLDFPSNLRDPFGAEAFCWGKGRQNLRDVLGWDEANLCRYGANSDFPLEDYGDVSRFDSLFASLLLEGSEDTHPFEGGDGEQRHMTWKGSLVTGLCLAPWAAIMFTGPRQHTVNIRSGPQTVYRLGHGWVDYAALILNQSR